MTIEELEALKADLRAVRKAVERHSPLFREIAATDFLARLSIPYAFLTIAFGLGTHLLLAGGSDYSKLPSWWLPAFYAFAVLLIVVGGVFKMGYIKRRAARVAPGVGALSVYAAIWSGTSLHINGPLALIALAASISAATAGHSLQILTVTSLWFGLTLIVMGGVVRRREYGASGWYGVLAGIASLFLVEAAPWLLFAATWGGMLLVFGLLGVLPEAASGVDE
jgi:hypothetical protein